MPTPPRTDQTAGLRAAAARAAGTADPSTGTVAKKPPSLREWLAGLQDDLQRALPAGGLTSERLARIVLTEVNRIPKLGQCTQESFAGALMTCAQLGLEPGAATGEAYLLPFRNTRRELVDGKWTSKTKMEVTFVLGYQGMVKLFWQSPLAKSIDAEVVYEHDEFDYAKGLEPKLIHKPKLGGDRGAAIAYYAVVTLSTGGSAFVVLSPSDVERIRERSKAKDDGPWQTDYDAMARKTAIRQLFKLLPKSTALQRAMAQDDQVRTDPSMDGIDIAAEPFPEDRIYDPNGVDTETGEVPDAGGDDDPNGPTPESIARLNAEAETAAKEAGR